MGEPRGGRLRPAARARTAIGRGAVTAAGVALATCLALSGCAVTAPAAARQPGADPVPSAVGTPASATPSGDPTQTPVTLNAPLPTAITPPPPLDPLAGLGRKERAKFRACLDARVGAGSGGTCARLATTRLKQAGFYPWAIPSRVSTTGVNALLNYQRSRGLVATGTTTKATWIALANREPLLPKVLPKTCLTKGIVLCVDQAHRRLYWMRNGKQVRSFKVRLGGYNSHPKTGDWRVFPTANGTWHVYDKQVDPKSENYGSGAMPYSTMFYPDMYVHYSPGFHSVGYAGSSHGCVNIGNLAEAVWIFNHTPIGSKVHIFSPTAA